MTREQFDEVLKRYLADQCTGDEIHLINDWLESIKASEGGSAALNEDNKEIIRNKVWFGIEHQLLAGETANTGFNYWRVGSVAASVVFVIASIFLVNKYIKNSVPGNALALAENKDIVRYSNTSAKPKLIHLADGSTILLHPGSEVKYPKAFGDTREVILKGEAFFQVAKDPKHPFLVYSNEVTTRVLGTSFQIKAYENQKEVVVSVMTGRVSVFSKTDASKQVLQEIVLTPNQEVVYNRNVQKAEKRIVENPKTLIAEQSMDLIYTNEPVTKLFKDLGTLYGIEIKYDESILANCNITTEMTDEGLYERLEVICHVINAKYSIEDTAIVIKASGCNN